MKISWRETPHFPTVTLTADEFQRSTDYRNWRPRGATDWLLILTVGGAGCVESDGVPPVAAVSGTVTLFEPGAPQRYFTDPSVGRWHILWSHFHARAHWGVWINWPGRGLRSLHLDPEAFRQSRRALRDTIRLARQPLPGSADLAVNALERALLWMHAAGARRALDQRIRRAVEWITSHPSEQVVVADLARDCGLSESRFAHLFRAEVGQAPQQYIEEIRLQRAAQLLRTTSLRVGEIASESGYADAFYFSARFRRKFGVPPTAYRAGGPF